MFRVYVIFVEATKMKPEFLVWGLLTVTAAALTKILIIIVFSLVLQQMSLAFSTATVIETLFHFPQKCLGYFLYTSHDYHMCRLKYFGHYISYIWWIFYNMNFYITVTIVELRSKFGLTVDILYFSHIGVPCERNWPCYNKNPVDNGHHITTHSTHLTLPHPSTLTFSCAVYLHCTQLYTWFIEMNHDAFLHFVLENPAIKGVGDKGSGMEAHLFGKLVKISQLTISRLTLQGLVVHFVVRKNEPSYILFSSSLELTQILICAHSM